MQSLATNLKFRPEIHKQSMFLIPRFSFPERQKHCVKNQIVYWKVKEQMSDMLRLNNNNNTAIQQAT